MARPKSTTHKKLKVLYRGNSIHLYGYDNDAEQPTPYYIATIKQNAQTEESEVFKRFYKQNANLSKKFLFLQKAIFKDLGNMFKEFTITYSIDEYPTQDPTDKRHKITAEYKADCEKFLKDLQGFFYAQFNVEFCNVIRWMLFEYEDLIKKNKIEVDRQAQKYYLDAIHNLLYTKEYDQLNELPVNHTMIGFDPSGFPLDEEIYKDD